MISASHNPIKDNLVLKSFQKLVKLTDEIEEEIEKLMEKEIF